MEGRRGGGTSSAQSPADGVPRRREASWASAQKLDAAHGAPRKGESGAAGAAGRPSLDSLTHNRNTDPREPQRKPYCGIRTFLRRRMNGDREEFDWLRQKCKGWNCGDCGPRKAYRLRKAIEEK